MKIEFNGTYKNEIVRKEPLYLNTITIKRNDGKIVVIDRDETYYSIENGHVDILFRGVYEWKDDKIYPNNNDTKKLYDGALIIGFNIEDDAPKAYDLVIENQKISAW